jgi:hypothetical protein
MVMLPHNCNATVGAASANVFPALFIVIVRMLPRYWNRAKSPFESAQKTALVGTNWEISWIH